MISIERANTEDAAELLQIKIRAFRDEVALYGFGPQGYDSYEQQLRAIQENQYFKIMYAGKMIGGICVRVLPERSYWIGALYIDTLYQNSGLGSKAMEILEKKFPDAVSWSLDTPYLSFRNHHFYEKLGYKKIRTTVPDERGFYLFVYKKDII